MQRAHSGSPAFRSPSINSFKCECLHERVETPWTWASCTTAVSAFSAIRRGSRKPGVGAFAQLGNAQLDGAGASLPAPIAIAVALRQALLALLAVTCPGPRPRAPSAGGRQTRSSRAKDRRVFSTSAHRFHHVVGHRWFLESGWCCNPTDESSVISRSFATALLGGALPVTPPAGTRPINNALGVHDEHRLCARLAAT
jgi:hypothetical protein